ncbi:MAG: B12-binding domain-containing radical SAM protein [Planctomycetaceae bacterium]|nr:B12-binding domain-containing radical SAM protein [Planctomycetaceae bacterium]
MNILLLYTNINGFHEDLYSFGIASIASLARSAGHSVRIRIVRSAAEYPAVLDEAAAFAPRMVGFTSVSSQFVFVKELAQAVKARLGEALTICGGVHPTINPQCLAGAAGLDALMVGESELSFQELLAALDAGRDWRGIDNIATRDGDGVKVNPLKPLLTDLSPLPWPMRRDYPFGDSLDKIGYVPFMFSRGCPYLCTYCSNHAIAAAYGQQRNSPRYRSAESSIQEIEDAMTHMEVRRVLICDDIFGIDRAWRREFCEKYAQRIRRPMLCLLRANVMDDEFLTLLKAAGCYRISIGVESGNDFVRNEVMNRKMSREQIVSAFALARKHGIGTMAINMIGLPGETEEMLWDTIRLNRRLKPTFSGVNIFYPYRGTKLGDHCFDNDLVDLERYANFSNERRESVLKLPESYRAKLTRYHHDWESLVYPWSLGRRLRRIFGGTRAWGLLRSVKRSVARASRP